MMMMLMKTTTRCYQTAPSFGIKTNRNKPTNERPLLFVEFTVEWPDFIKLNLFLCCPIARQIVWNFYYLLWCVLWMCVVEIGTQDQFWRHELCLGMWFLSVYNVLFCPKSGTTTPWYMVKNAHVPKYHSELRRNIWLASTHRSSIKCVGELN